MVTFSSMWERNQRDLFPYLEEELGTDSKTANKVNLICLLLEKCAARGQK